MDKEILANISIQYEHIRKVNEMAEEPGLQSKIYAKCFDCIGGGENWQHWVHECDDYGCPLYTVRPYCVE